MPDAFTQRLIGGGAAGARSGQIIALLAVLIGLGAALLGEARWLVADDDNLWLAALVRADSPAPLRHLEDQMIDGLHAQGVSANDILRFENRRDYGGNYIGAIQLWRFASSWFAASANLADASADALAKRMVIMFTFGIGMIWLLFGLVLARLGDASLQRAALVGLAFIALWFALVPIEFSQKLGLDKSIAHVLPDALFTLLRPHDGLSLFGFTGRNLFTVLFLAAMLSRWSGRDRNAALLLLIATLMHGSYGSMMLAFVLLCDLLNRPSNLRDPVYGALLAVMALYSFGSETLWRTTLRLDSTAWIGVVLVAIGVAILLLRLRSKQAGANRPMRDVAVLAGLWLATLPIAVVMCHVADPTSVEYFWSQLHARTLGVLQPVFAVALGLWLMHDEGFSRGLKALLISLAIALPIDGLRGLMSSNGAVPRLTASYSNLQQRLSDLPQPPPLAAINSQREELTYFAIERALSGYPSALVHERLTP